MHCLITICSKEKSSSPGEVPALERYQSARIASVHERSRRENTPMLIFSGKYGLIEPETRIPYYDHLLQADEVHGFVGPTAEILKTRGITTVTFAARPREEAGWKNYYQVIERACVQAGASLEIEIYPTEKSPPGDSAGGN